MPWEEETEEQEIARIMAEAKARVPEVKRRSEKGTQQQAIESELKADEEVAEKLGRRSRR